MNVNIKVLSEKVPRTLQYALLIVLLAKLLVFAIGYVVTAVNTGQNPLLTFTDMFNRWDSQIYVNLANNWYVSNPAVLAYNYIVFFPLYPALIRALTFNLDYTIISALIISNISSIIGFIYLYKLAKLEFNEGVALKAVVFLSVFPTAYFLSVPYTEGVLFALAMASLYYARLGRWQIAGSLGFFAALTRIAGLLLLPVLLVEYFHQKGWKPRKVGINVLWVFLALAGFACYLLLNFQVTGNPFTFVGVESSHWSNHLAPWWGLMNSIGYAIGGHYPDNLYNIAALTGAVFGLLTIVLAYRKRMRPVYLSYLLLFWGLAISTSNWQSVPRYILSMFPMFMLLGVAVNRKAVIIGITVASTMLLCYFTYLFTAGLWAF